MSVPVWPIELPQQPLHEGYLEVYPDMTLRSPMDTGPAKVRRKCSNIPFRISIAFYLSDAEKDTLDQFVTTTLENGALRFGFTHPTKNVPVEVRIVGDGDALYQVLPSGRGYNVQMTLEVLP